MKEAMNNEMDITIHDFDEIRQKLEEMYEFPDASNLIENIHLPIIMQKE